MYDSIKENIKKLSESLAAIQSRAQDDGRALTAQEVGLVTELEAAINDERRKLPANSPLTLQNNLHGQGADTEKGFIALRNNEKISQKCSAEKPVWTIADFVKQGMGVKKELRNTSATSVISSPATVPTGVSNSIIDAIRAKSRLVQAGAVTYIITEPTNMARIDSDPTVYLHAEGVEDITASLPVFSPVSLNPPTLAAAIPLSMELVSDSKNLDSALHMALAGAFALKLDALGIAAILADETIADSGSGEDCATWEGILAGVTSALALDMDLPAAIIANPADFVARMGELATDSGVYLNAPGALASMLDLFTTSMTVGHAVFGDYSRGVGIAMRQDLMLELVRFGKPLSASHILMATMRAQVFVAQPGALYHQTTTVPVA